jgi:thiamine biosynthesis lipoprotein
MRLGRFFFAGAVILGLAYFALRSPIPAADPRFLQAEVADAGAPASIAVYLETGYLRERAQSELKLVADELRKARRDAGGDPAAQGVQRAEALERGAARLQAAGITNAMLRCGGNLVVRGRRGNAPWRVGLRDPQGRFEAIAYLLADRDEAVASVGEARAVTVLGPAGPAAAAQAAELAAAPPGAWRELARQGGIEQAMVVEADGSVSVTKALNERLKFFRGLTPTVLP